MRLTPEILEAAYRFLAATPPFKFWHLPASHAISWRVTRHQDRLGEHGHESGRNHHIAVSEINVGHTATLLAVIAHEMVHLRLASLNRPPVHGAEFRRLWRQVCRHHGWDPKTL